MTAVGKHLAQTLSFIFALQYQTGINNNKIVIIPSLDKLSRLDQVWQVSIQVVCEFESSFGINIFIQANLSCIISSFVSIGSFN